MNMNQNNQDSVIEGRESITQYCLTHNLTSGQQANLGVVDFASPSCELIEKEEARTNFDDSFAKDAKTCARIITLLLIAKDASFPIGISRRNALASERIYSALQFYCEGRTLESIGEELGKSRQSICRYNERFMAWSAKNGSAVTKRVTPESLVLLMFQFKQPLHSLKDAFDELRISLYSTLQKLTEAANKGNTEVFRSPENFTDCPLTANILTALSYKGGK